VKGNDEARMTKNEGNPNNEAQTTPRVLDFGISCFVINSSFHW